MPPVDSRPKFCSADSPGPGAGLLLIFFACTLLTSLLLLGETLWPLHLTVAALFTLLLHTARRLSAGLSPKGFTLDDPLQALVTLSGRTVPYVSIRAVQLCRAPDLLTVRLSAGPFQRRQIILKTREPAEASRLAEALRQRRLPAMLKPVRLGQRTQERLLLMVMPLTLLIMLWVTFDLYRKIPNLRIPAVARAPAVAAWVVESEYALGGTVFYLPAEFIIRQSEADRMTFLDAGTQTSVSAGALPLLDVSRKSWPARQLLYYAGLRDDYAWLSMALKSRVGLLPLTFKASLLGGFQPGRAEVYTVSAGPFRGFVLRGPLRLDAAASGAGHRSEIILTDRAGGRFIRFTISGSRSADERLQDRIIAGVG